MTEKGSFGSLARHVLQLLKETPRSDKQLQDFIPTIIPVGIAHRRASGARRNKKKTDAQLVADGYKILLDATMQALVKNGYIVRHSDGLWYLRDEGHSEHYHVDRRSPERRAMDNLLLERSVVTRQEIAEVVKPLVPEMKAVHMGATKNADANAKYNVKRKTLINVGQQTVITHMIKAVLASGMVEREGDDKYRLTEKGRRNAEKLADYIPKKYHWYDAAT